MREESEVGGEWCEKRARWKESDQRGGRRLMREESEVRGE